MIKALLSSILRKKNVSVPQQASVQEKEPKNPLGNGFYWEYEQIRNGLGGYKTVNVYLMKMGDPGFRRCIVDHFGQIQNFPGFKNNEWRKDLEFSFNDGAVNFVFCIYPYQDGKARVRWLVQPDGRYFEDDDGFGAEHCEEIEMYSDLDENGLFTAPFFRE